jgi:excisionase family DNA binding protein
MRDNLVTVREAANYLRISARTVYRLIESGQIGAVRIGKQWRIPASDLPGHEALATQASTGATETQATA